MTTISGNIKEYPRALLRGVGQVMFQGNAWTGLLFIVGIFWGSYQCGTPQVAWAGVVGVIASTIAGQLLGQPQTDGAQGLWGFNGVLVGCGFATFLPNTWLMWVSMIFCAMLSTWVRTGLNNVMAPWKVNSLTFPFVLITWIFLFASRIMNGLDPTTLTTPGVPAVATPGIDTSFVSLVIYWLKGVAQVFLIDSWVAGVFFLAALAISNKWAAIWAAAGSTISLAIALLFMANGTDISSGLFGFSPVLTGIAIGMTFYSVNRRSALWAIAAIVATVFIQAAMDVFFEPWGIPTLTGPFCVATWLFLLPRYKFIKQAAPSDRPMG